MIVHNITLNLTIDPNSRDVVFCDAWPACQQAGQNIKQEFKGNCEVVIAM